MMPIFIFLACFVAWLLALVPSVTYLRTDWKARRDRLFAAIGNDGALQLYYKQFYPAQVNQIAPNFRKQFEGDFHRLYGRRRYIVPMTLLALISALGMFWLADTLRTWFKLEAWLTPMPALGASAFLGAFAWVLLDQFKRFQSRNFSKHDIYNCAYRFLIAAPLAYSFASVAQKDVGVAIAFLIGTFPTQTIIKFGRRLFIQRTGITDAETDSGGPTELTKLQGIGKENAERLEQIGITTMPELAWIDPVDITLRTNFDFNYVVDCISQALLWVYFEDKTKLLYPLGIRGAQEVISTLEQSKTGVPQASAAVASGATLLGVDQQSFLNALDQVASDPYAQFIYHLWEYPPTPRPQVPARKGDNGDVIPTKLVEPAVQR